MIKQVSTKRQFDSKSNWPHEVVDFVPLRSEAIDPADLKAVAKFASKDKARPILNSVRVSVKDGRTTLAATDSYHLAVIGDSLVDPTEYDLLPAEWASKVKTTKSAGPVLVEVSERFIRITQDGESATQLRILGDYPPISRLWRTEHLTDLEIKGEVPSTVQFAGKEHKAEGVVVLADGAIHPYVLVVSTMVYGTRKDYEDHLQSLGQIVARFNLKFLSDCVAFAGSTMRFVDDLKPVEFRRGDRRCLLMSVRKPVS
jgi:hypothetical protein